MFVRAILCLAALCACAHADVTLLSSSSVTATLQNTTSGLYIVLTRNEVSEVLASVGRLASAIVSMNSTTAPSLIKFNNNVSLTVSSEVISGTNPGNLLSFSWEAPASVTLEDCVYLYAGLKNWYGGPQQKQQHWPIENLVLSNYSYITKEADNCGVAEPYWLNSDGVFYYFDKKVPLFVNQNSTASNATCFVADVRAPYSSNRTMNYLIYSIGIFDNVRKAHEYAIGKFLGKPSGLPDELMIKYPIWSTWARYKTAINHDVVLAFADQITAYGFPNSQLEIDDLWEICYGSQTVDVLRFPNMKNTTDTLKAKGYRVTMWTHPFINQGCEPWYSNAVANGYVVSSESSTVESSWWNNNGTTTSYIDFTKEAARNWYINRLVALQNSTGVDGFKFDGGESSWSPQIPVLQGDIYDQPNVITADYVRAVAAFGDLTEVRSGHGTQDLPIMIRIIDKDSYWTFENGLPTLITTTLQLNINGYTMVLPDMIGGNGYEGSPSKELFIRWLQATTFMPALQFSYVPWDYDNETVTISKTFVNLHAEYTPQIIAALNNSKINGYPVNAPLWWIAPNDTETYDIWDQYLLGDSIIVAPVVVQGATSRDIYLPEGTWYDRGNTSTAIMGPGWIRNYPAPLDVLPFFVLDTSGSQATVLGSAVLVLAAVIANIINQY